MKLNNHLGWPGFIFRQYNPRAELNVAFTTIQVYDIVNNATELVESESDERSILLKDEYIGEKPSLHLFRQADFIPYKPGTDVTAIAQTWSPSGEPEKTWTTSIEIKRAKTVISKKLRVFGSRVWKKNSTGEWKLSEPETVKSVPLDYYHAYGGEKLDEPVVEGAPRNINIYNPLGPGVIENRKFKPENSLKAHQIEAIDIPVEAPFEDYLPEGFAPIAPFWRFRQQYAGTYDQDWLDTHHPFLPSDFDYHFYNCAHPDLIIKPYLQPGDKVCAVNLHPYFKRIEFSIPDLKIGAICTYENGETKFATMALDGVHLELLQAIPKVRLTWRSAFAWNKGIDKVDIGKLDFERLNELLTKDIILTKESSGE